MPQEPRFNECDVQSALRDVSMGTSVYTAAKRWRIPKSTLLYRTRGSTDRATVGAARRKISKAQDNHLARWVVRPGGAGVPRRAVRAVGLCAEGAGDERFPRTAGDALGDLLPEEVPRDHEGQR